MFLTTDEISTLTGYQTQSRQIMWLKSHGWKFEISRTGHPVVLRKHAETKMSGQEENEREWAPNFDAFKKVA